jgi:hypothetical protein
MLPKPPADPRPPDDAAAMSLTFCTNDSAEIASLHSRVQHGPPAKDMMHTQPEVEKGSVLFPPLSSLFPLPPSLLP